MQSVDELILRTVVIQFDGRVVEVFGTSVEAIRNHVALRGSRRSVSRTTGAGTKSPSGATSPSTPMK